MTDESQILQLSGLTPMAILEAVQKLLEQSDFDKFTLVLKRKPKQHDQIFATCLSKRREPTKYSAVLNSRCLSELSCKYPAVHSQRLSSVQDTQTPIQQGLRLYYQGFFQGALQVFQQQKQVLIDSFKQGVQTVKDYQDIYFHIGNCYYRLKNYDKAIQYFSYKFKGEDIKQQGQKNNNLGSCYAHTDQPRLSLNSYSEALKIYAPFPEIDCSNLLNNVGMLYAQSEMFQTAQKYFLQSIQERKNKSPDSNHLLYSSYLQLGNCRKHSKKYIQAISSLQVALDLAERGFGNTSDTLFQLASIYQLCQKWTEALDCYQKLSQREAKKGFLYERAAQIHRQLGRHSDHDRFIGQAFQQYQKERNQRKLSELRPVVSRLTRH